MSQIDTLTDLLKARYSCRAFRADPVPRAVIEQIVSTAQHVPSWCNAQPWQTHITMPEATERFRTGLQEAIKTGTAKLDLPGPTGYPGVYGERRRTCGWQLYDAVGVQKGDRVGSATQMMRNFALFDAPHVAILSSPRDLGAYGALDTGGFITAFTLAAKALGVDTIPQAAVATYAKFVREFFEIGYERVILCAISFGYGEPDHPANSFRTERAELDEIVEWCS